jgi:fucose 4-O-acetylase-like acetyltransferase
MDGKRKENYVYIDVLKSIACLCVLIGHVLNGMIKAGMEVAPVLVHLNTFVYLFHVPCFFFASGYLYAKNKITSLAQYLHFIRKKLIVLGLPYLVCSIAYVLFSSFLGGEMNTAYSFEALLDLWREPVAQYWYLYALFEFFLLIPILESVFQKAGSEVFLCLLTVLAFLTRPDLKCVAYVMEYAYIFYLGVFCCRKGVLNDRRVTKWNPQQILLCSVGGSALIYGLYVLLGLGSALAVLGTANLKSIVRPLLVLMITGISFAISQMESKVRRFLVWLSQYSLYIYLLHTWFSGTMRVVLRRAGITNCWIQAGCGIAVGLVGSLCAAVVIRKIPVLRFWFEPLKVMRRKES